MVELAADNRSTRVRFFHEGRMAAKLNGPICMDCAMELDEETQSHWKDESTLDHKDLCCECFDVALGMPEHLAPARLKRKLNAGIAKR